MKTKTFYLLLITFVTCITNAQNVVKVQSKHSKVLVQTLKEGEFLSQGEWKINIKQSGIGYEFNTQNQNYQFNLYKDSKFVGEFADIHFSSDKYWKTKEKTLDKSQYTLHLENGRKFGPYDVVYPLINYDLPGRPIYAIEYEIEKNRYIYLLEENNTIGPHESISIERYEKNNVIIRWKKDNKWYVSRNGKIDGPFLDARFPYLNNENYIDYYSVKNEDLKWSLILNNVKQEYLFEEAPFVSRIKENEYAITGTFKENGKKVKYQIIKGEKHLIQYGYSDVFINNNSDVLYIKQDSVFCNTLFLGSYKTDYISNTNRTKSPFFDILLYKMEGEIKEYFITNGKEVIAIGTDQEINRSTIYLLGEDYKFIRKIDSLLITNGKVVGTKKLVNFIIKENYPLGIEWSIEGDFDVFSYNNKELSSKELEAVNYNTQWLNLKDNHHVFVKEDDKTYLKITSSGKKIGPVGRNNTFAFSKNNKYFAENDQRKREVFIDGKLFSPGFCLTYNEKENTFLWLSQKENKIYLHTYRNY